MNHKMLWGLKMLWAVTVFALTFAHINCMQMESPPGPWLSATPGMARTAPPQAPEVKAGWADDNQQYNYYLNYLERFSKVQALKLNVNDRVVLTVLDSQGRPMHNQEVVFRSGPDVACRRSTYADGRVMFFPHEDPKTEGCRIQVELPQPSGPPVTKALDLQGPSAVEIRLPRVRPQLAKVPLDVAFLFDTTGSMGDEIAALKQTLDAIQVQVTNLSPQPDVRFGMVLYRDQGSEYVTRILPFTSDFQRFTRDLAAVQAAGGNDEPEDVQSALKAAMQDLAWRPDAVKLAFLIGDAPPHLDYRQEYTYVHAMRTAAQRAIKITAVGAKGLNEQGEYVWRQLAQYTRGLFVFLTYGETGEAHASAWTVSHHTGGNFESRNLDAIIVQAIARELSHLGDRPVTLPEDYFVARPAEGVQSTAVLEDLFKQCARQLVDFSQVKIEPGTAAAVAPPTAEGCPADLAGRLGDRLSLALSSQKTFRLMEREDLAKVLDELAVNKDSAFNQPLAVPAGKQVPAKILVVSKVRKSPAQYEMFVKMLRVETGEVLSATLVKIDPRLVE